MKHYEVYKKAKVWHNRPAILHWKEVSKATYDKYPVNKRRIKDNS